MPHTELKQRCHTVVPGHFLPAPCDYFSALAAWCREQHAGYDMYGDGALLQAFEQKVADLFGFEAGVFMITGTMAQTIALRVATDARGRKLVALHPTSHILVHERSNYQLLDHFKALEIGDPHRPWQASDLAAIPGRLGAAMLELPMRELGGQLTDWEQLEAIKGHCKQHDIHLHMDGARVLESAAGYGRPYREIAAGFDSAYVSLYKGLNGLGGAMLLGSKSFIAECTEWMRRMGGNVIYRTPYVAAAAMQFDARVAAMPAYFARTRWLYEQL
ncbi:MAG TPA: beta-eliminating lyase-related protein, partial [Burkholderiaceae bacterium]